MLNSLERKKHNVDLNIDWLLGGSPTPYLVTDHPSLNALGKLPMNVIKGVWSTWKSEGCTSLPFLLTVSSSKMYIV